MGRVSLEVSNHYFSEYIVRFDTDCAYDAASFSKSKGRRRPTRVLGATLPGLQLPIPSWVRKEFSAGWNDHIPLTYLTDDHCQETAWDDILSPPAPAPKRETDLDFAEWHQAWLRLLCLIADYLPEEHAAWTIHFTRIRDMDNVVSEWDHWLLYDIEVRRCACFNPLDPAIFHSSIWNDLRLKILSNRVKDVALETFRVIQKSTSASNFHEASSRVKRRLEEVVQGTKRLRQHSSRNLKGEREREREGA